jgi:DNA-binding transcriptional LysR family regulator
MKLNLRSIDLNLLPVFVAIVEEGQLSRAAQRLGMSQPAVSAALQRLRVTLADVLFTRSSKGLTPTPHARELYAQIQSGLQILAEALDSGQRFEPRSSDRQFSIAAVDYFESMMLGPLLSLLRDHGEGLGVRVEPQHGDWLRRVLDAEVDFGLDTQMPEDDRLGAEAVSEEALTVVARRGHPNIQGSVSLAQFLDASHVVLPLLERRVLPLDQILGRPGWRRRIGAQVSQYANLLSVASSTDLIATVPLRLANSLADHLSLQVLPFPVPVPPVIIYLIWPKALERDPAHQWFRRVLTKSLATVR